MNLLTEEEARTKWCPFTRVGIYSGPGLAAVNRHPSDGTDRPDIESETRCIASKCMMWRKTTEDRYFWPSEPASERVRIPAGSGCCGLAAVSTPVVGLP